MADPLFTMHFDADDRALLEALAEHEKLARADVIRRAIRAYARKLRVRVRRARSTKKS